MQQRRIGILFFFLSHLSFFTHAGKTIVYSEPLIKIEDDIASDARLTIVAHDLTFDKISNDRDTTYEHVYYRENTQEALHFDFNNDAIEKSHQSLLPNDDRSDYSSSNFCDNHNSHDVSLYIDVESNRRDMQNDMYADAYSDNSRNNAVSPFCNRVDYPHQTLFGFKAIWPDNIAFKEELGLWQQELDLWQGKSREVALRRYEARVSAYYSTIQDPMCFKRHNYKLSEQAIAVIERNKVDTGLFKQGLYNSLQHQVHTELIDIVEQTVKLVNLKGFHKALNSSSQVIVCTTATGVQFNKIGDVIKAVAIADYCWASLACTKAVIEGIASGVVDVASYAIQSPHELILYGLAPEIMGGYYTLKLMHSIGELVVDIYTTGTSKYFEESFKNAHVSGVIYGTSSLITRFYLNSKLDKQIIKRVGASKESFVAAIKNKEPRLCFALSNVRQNGWQHYFNEIKNKKISNKIEELTKYKIDLQIEQKSLFEAAIKGKLAESINGNKYDLNICLKKILPENPKDLKKYGWTDITDPRVPSTSNSRLFKQEKYGLTMRYDKAALGAQGFKGKDHYQILNPLSKHDSIYYLDIHANLLPRNNKQSHILLEQLKNKCCL